MIWVYGICSRYVRPQLPVHGRGQAPLELVTHGSLLAVVSHAASGDEAPSTQGLHAHARVVDALMDQTTVLPVRFGTHFAEPLAVRSALAVRRQPLLAALAQVGGCVEMAVRASLPDRRHLVAVDRLPYPPDRRLKDALHDPLAGLAVAARVWPALVPGEVLRAAYLVPRAELPAFQEAAAELEQAFPRVALTCTGPWPTYSFVDGADAR
jgi:hypothetical protein